MADAPVIRHADSGDLEAVLGIETLCFPEPWSINYLQAALQDLFWVCEHRGRVVAYLIAVAAKSVAKATIMKLAVHPEHRGHGYAKTLVHQCIEACASRGIKEVVLDAKMIGPGVVGFYQKLGFEMDRVISLDSESEDYTFFSMSKKILNA